MSRLIRTCAIALLGAHLAWRSLSPDGSFLRDVVLYNAIWILALTLVLSAPLEFDRVALASIAVAIAFWGCGSLATSITEFLSLIHI